MEIPDHKVATPAKGRSQSQDMIDRSHGNSAFRRNKGGARGRIRTGNLSLIWRSRSVRRGSVYKAAALPLSYPGIGFVVNTQI